MSSWPKNCRTNWFKNSNEKKSMPGLKINIGAADLVEMGSLSSKNRGVEWLLCVIDVFTKYTWVKPVKDKKSKKLLNGFIKIVNKWKRNPYK